MKLFEFETFLTNNVRKFCFLFDNTYTKDIFFESLKKKGYTLRQVTDPESFKSLAFKSSIFEKTCYVSPYIANLWKWLEGKQPLNLFIMVANDSKTKAAEPFQGPSEAEYLRDFRSQLEAKNVRFSDQSWNALVNRFRNKDRVIEDPKGLYNAAYSIGIQVENPDPNIINQFFGMKVQFWDLFNSILAKDKRRTLLAMHTLLADNEPVGMIVGMQKMLCDLMSAKDSLKSKKSPEAYAFEHKIQPYRAQMLFNQAKTLDDQLEARLLTTFSALDMKLKSKSFFSQEEIFRTSILSLFDQ